MEEQPINKHPANENEPLKLSELRDRVSSKTYKWLLESEPDSDCEAECTGMGFFSAINGEDDEDWIRVREWCSSQEIADGIGGYCESADLPADDQEDGSTIRVKYILSSASGGHGNDLWAASRHVANRLANAESCRSLLSPIWKDQNEIVENPNKHPILGLKLLELGAGAGLPSWTAMWRGAKVVCTDRAIPDRIRCMAESSERNLRAMTSAGVDKEILVNAMKAQACPYDWGTSITDISESLAPDSSEAASFDIIVAADCIYMPAFQDLLLESINLLLSKSGVAILPFSLHGNTDDDNVWGILELAKEKGFQVEKLESQQLTPQAYGMDPKRALVHTIRLTRA
jgi:predicted nicotinamide N-methyase